MSDPDVSMRWNDMGWSDPYVDGILNGFDAMIRWCLVVLCPTVAFAQSIHYGFGASGDFVRQPTGFAVCAYGDSITNNGWFAPLTDAGITLIKIAVTGVRMSGASPDDGDDLTAGCFTPLPCIAEGPSCKDVIGGTAIESLCIADMATYCDVGVAAFGTNDASASVGTVYRDGLVTVVNAFKAQDIPLVIWRPIPRKDASGPDAEVRDNIQPLIDAALATAAYARVSEVDAYALWTTYRADQGDAAFFELYNDCAGEYASSGCIHPNIITPNSKGVLGADLIGEQMLRAVRGAMRSQ